MFTDLTVKEKEGVYVVVYRSPLCSYAMTEKDLMNMDYNFCVCTFLERVECVIEMMLDVDLDEFLVGKILDYCSVDRELMREHVLYDDLEICFGGYEDVSVRRFWEITTETEYGGLMTIREGRDLALTRSIPLHLLEWPHTTAFNRFLYFNYVISRDHIACLFAFCLQQIISNIMLPTNVGLIDFSSMNTLSSMLANYYVFARLKSPIHLLADLFCDRVYFQELFLHNTSFKTYVKNNLDYTTDYKFDYSFLTLGDEDPDHENMTSGFIAFHTALLQTDCLRAEDTYDGRSRIKINPVRIRKLQYDKMTSCLTHAVRIIDSLPN